MIEIAKVLKYRKVGKVISQKQLEKIKALVKFCEEQEINEVEFSDLVRVLYCKHEIAHRNGDNPAYCAKCLKPMFTTEKVEKN